MRPIESLSDLDAALGEKNRAVVLFKHSTRCPISARAFEEYRDLIREEPQAALYTILDLVARRDVSNAVEKRLGVRHESPQAIVMAGGEVRAVFTHFDIRKQALREALTSSRQDTA